MNEGSTTLYVFEGMVEDAPPTLRIVGSLGPCINAYVSDGALASSLRQRFKFLHVAYYQQADVGDVYPELALTNWIIAV